MLIDLVQLRTFVAVAEEQHLTRAAERLHISQSAASAHVRAVESSLDTQLFIRTNRSLELTKPGQILLSQAKRLLSEAAQFSSSAREMRGKIEGSLIVGTSPEPDSRIGEIIGQLRAAHSLVSVDLRARPSEGAWQGLRSGELDVCVLLGGPVDASYTFYELTKVYFHVAGPAAWRERLENADWADLAQMPWIVARSVSSAYSSMLANLFERRGLTLNAVAHFDNPAIGRAMLQAGVGLMLLREEHLERGLRDGTLAASPLARVEYALSIAHQTNRKEDPLIKAFVDAASMVWPDMRMTKPSGARPIR